MLTCRHGCKHEFAGCETEGCTRCDTERSSCDVAAFVDNLRAECQHTFARYADVGFLTGFTRRAAAALVHLREAWCVADEHNKPGVEAAITSLMHTRSMRSDMRFLELLAYSCGDETARALVEIAKCDDSGQET